MLYILKEVVQNPVTDSMGRQIHWDHTVDDIGVIAIDDSQPDKQALAAEMNAAAAKHTLGLVIITQQQYDEWKKKPHSPIRVKSPDGMGGQRIQRQHLGMPPVDVAGVNPSGAVNPALKGLTQQMNSVPVPEANLASVVDEMFSPRMAAVAEPEDAPPSEV